MTATRPGTSSASSSGVPPGWQNVKNYGALGDGTTDDSTSIQAAIDYVKTNGGVVYFPPGTYKVATTLNCKSTFEGALRGPECGMHFQAQSARLVYSGTTSGDQGGLLCMNGSSGWEIAYLGLDYSNASFTGDLVNVDGRGGVFADCQDWHIHHCGSWARTSITARSIVRLSFAIIGEISNCHFTGAINPLRIGDPGVGFVVSVSVVGCTFNFAKDSDAGQAMILVGTADGEAIQIKRCTFEAGTNTPGIRGATAALDGVGHNLYSPVVSENWFGDAGSAITWIKSLQVTSNNYVGTIRNNRFAGASTTGTHLILAGTWVVAENTAEDGAAFLSWGGGSSSPLALLHNYFNNITAVFAAGTRPTNVIMLGNLGAGVTPAADYNDVLQSRLAFGSGTGFAAGDATGKEQLVVGVVNNGGALVALPAKAGVYAALGSGATPGVLALQAPTGASPQEVQLIAGTTPAAVIRVADATLGFYNHAPVARTAAYTLNAGATARNLPAAGTVLDVEKALRQLITDLQANGLLQ